MRAIRIGTRSSPLAISDPGKAEEAGVELARKLIDRGAREFLENRK